MKLNISFIFIKKEAGFFNHFKKIFFQNLIGLKLFMYNGVPKILSKL